MGAYALSRLVEALDPESPASYEMERESAILRSTSIGRLSKLPPFHPAAMKLMTISTESNSAVFDFEDVFRGDPALATDLLVFANSPLFGLESRVTSVRHAIALMGLEKIRSLSYAVALQAYTRGAVAKDAVRRILAHSVATAVIAEAIAKASGANAAAFHTAGLLHDVGRLGLLKIDPDRYVRLLSCEYRDVQEALAMETLKFGCSHDDAGALLGRTWGLPTTVCDCIRFHHHEVASDAGELFSGVWRACQLANAMQFSVVTCTDRPAAPGDLIPEPLRRCPELALGRLRTQIELNLGTLNTMSPR